MNINKILSFLHIDKYAKSDNISTEWSPADEI